MKKLLPLVVVLAIVLGGLLLASCGQQSDPNVAALSGEKTRFQWVVADKATIEDGGLAVTGASTLSGASTLASLTVSGATALDGGLTMDTNKFTVANGTGDTVIAGTLAANGGLTVDTSNFTVSGTSGAVSTASNLTVGGTAKVTGATTITGTLTAVGTVAAADITASDDVTITDRLQVAGGNFTVGSTGALYTSIITAAGGNFTLDGSANLYTAGAISTDSDVTALGDLTVSGSTLITGDLTVNNLVTVDAAQGNVTLTAGAKILPTSGITNTSAVFSCVNSLAYTDVATKTMCLIPANANIVDYLFSVSTAFNDSGTDLLNCGWIPGATNELFADVSVATEAVGRPGVTSALGDIGAVALPIYCMYTPQNSNASAGAGTLVIYYIVD